ncbi:hypothetical protein B6D29_01115 [Microgenomates bacterium UTCPR1]|nr:MAG: hypothetical protein B6D29_01115 [Microgenomates bacterium UTCPR1]
MIFLSLKTYKEATGSAVLNLLSSVKRVSTEFRVPIIPVAQPTDIYRIKKELDIEVWAQHMDPIDPGRNMGWLSPYSLKDAGASGVVINHSEHKVSEDTIKKTLEKAKEYELKTLLISFDPQTVEKYDSFNPDFISYEKEDLIGTGVSMIKSEEENIKNLIKVLKKPLIIGAGISNGQDVKSAVMLGAKGVILASGFVLSENPEGELRELAQGFKQ